MPSQHDIVTAIEGIIKEDLDLQGDVGKLGPDTPLFEGGVGLDSFGIVELISELETQFSFEFSEDDFQEEHFRTVSTLGRLVDRYLNG